MKLDKHTIFSLVITFVLLLILFIDLFINVSHLKAFQERKEEGNRRWQQVDQILEEYDDKIVELETKINILQSGGN